MADDCERHRGANAETSPHIDKVMDSLPENQSGPGRHKCAYCAFEAGVEIGVEAGRKRERSRIVQGLGVSPDELEDI